MYDTSTKGVNTIPSSYVVGCVELKCFVVVLGHC